MLMMSKVTRPIKLWSKFTLLKLRYSNYDDANTDRLRDMLLLSKCINKTAHNK